MLTQMVYCTMPRWWLNWRKCTIIFASIMNWLYSELFWWSTSMERLFRIRKTVKVCRGIRRTLWGCRDRSEKSRICLIPLPTMKFSLSSKIKCSWPVVKLQWVFAKISLTIKFLNSWRDGSTTRCRINNSKRWTSSCDWSSLTHLHSWARQRESLKLFKKSGAKSYVIWGTVSEFWFIMAWIQRKTLSSTRT